MVNYYKRYIYKKGVKHGPYYYSNKKVNGKVISTYLGTSPPKSPEFKKPSKLNIKLLIFTLAIVSLGLLIYLSINLNLFSTGNPIRVEPTSIIGSLEDEGINVTINDTVSGFKPKIIQKSGTSQETSQAIETIQGPAAIGEPVSWEKQVKLTTKGPTKILIPASSENIVVYKIDESGNKNKVSESSIKITAKASAEIELDQEDSSIIKFFKKIFAFFKGTGKAVDIQTKQDIKEITVNENSDHYQIEYTTPAPTITEEETDKGKTITVSNPELISYTNVLTSTNLDENLNIQNPESVKILWVEQNQYIQPEKISDKDNNGIYDSLEFTAPLSNQTYEIIVITKAEHLDLNKVFISDIYTQVKELDDVWSETINDGDYVRITFEKNLTSNNDITIYPRIISGSPKIEVYEKNKNETIAEFSNITDNGYNQVLLTNLQEEQDTFDLKITGGSVEFDHVIDPYINITGTGWISQRGTSYLTVDSITWTADAGSRYLVMVFGEAISDSINAETRVGIYQNGVEQFYIADRPAVANTEIMPFSAMQVYEGIGSSVNYDVRISSSSSSATTSVRNVRIIAYRIDNLPNAHYNYTYNTIEQTNVNNAWGDVAGDTDEITFTPPTPGYYMIWAGASVDSGSTSSSASWRVSIDNGVEYIPYLTGTFAYARIEDRNSNERVNFNALAVRSFTAAPHSIKMQIADIDATASTDWRDRSVIVMRLSDVITNWWTINSLTQSIIASQTFQNKTTLSQPSTNGTYVVIGSQALRGDTTTVDFEQQLAIDGISQGLRAWRPKDTLDYPTEAFIANFSVTAGSHWSAMQFRRQDGSGGAYAKNSELLIFELKDQNLPPTIDVVGPVPDTMPMENNTVPVNFIVQVSDLDGYLDISNVSVNFTYPGGGEAIRNGSCVFQSGAGNTATYNCTVGMKYYDLGNVWSVNVTAKDLPGNLGINNTATLSYGFLSAMAIISPIGALTWPTLNSEDTNQSASNDPVIFTNTGNQGNNPGVTAHNLTGETNPSESIPATNFWAAINNGAECGNTRLQESAVWVAGSYLPKGSDANPHPTEEIYFCLRDVPSISSQNYSAKGANAWIIAI